MRLLSGSKRENARERREMIAYIDLKARPEQQDQMDGLYIINILLSY